MTKKVLLIEDSAADAQMVKEFIEQAGVEVDVAITGAEGLKKAREIRPDLIFLDIVLPDIDGFEVCADIKGDMNLSKTIVVMLTIKDDIDDITKAFNLGADDYFVKPPLPEFITRKVKLYLGIKDGS